MEQNLINDDLIRHLCALHDETLSKKEEAKQPEQRKSNGPVQDETAKSQTTWFVGSGNAKTPISFQ